MSGGKKSGGTSGSGHRTIKTRVKTARGRKPSSTQWLNRQLNDPYVQKAKQQGYRSRAAYKLLQIHEKTGILKYGQVVVDLGAAPGSWSQVALEFIKPEKSGGHVIGLDLLPVDAMAHAHFIEGDFMDEAVYESLVALIGDRKVDLVLSDIAPSTTGHRDTDHLRIVAMVEAAADFAIRYLKPGGAFVAKVFQGGTEQSLLAELKKRFAVTKHIKPDSSRKESPETFLIATGFKS